MYRNFFPPAEEHENEHEQFTDETKLVSQLPDAPTAQPKEVQDTQQPSTKKQKTNEIDDDDYFMVDKDQGSPKSEL